MSDSDAEVAALLRKWDAVPADASDTPQQTDWQSVANTLKEHLAQRVKEVDHLTARLEQIENSGTEDWGPYSLYQGSLEEE